jgi:hypothetical protein
VAAGIVSFVFYATALESGSVTVATSAVVLAETLPPAVVGVLFLGDTTRHGLTPVAAVGFGLAVVSAVMLARFGEADHAPGGGAAREPAAGSDTIAKSDNQRLIRLHPLGRVILVARGPADLRRNIDDHGSPSWPHQRLSPG